jgi:Flp pilus assembly secretin CpaC
MAMISAFNPWIKKSYPAIAVVLLAGAALLATNSRPVAQGLDDIIVTYDQSQLLSLPRPAAEIIIGNPVIADVSVQSGNLLVITGKSFGITNMIALDAKRQIIFDRRILVKRDDVRVVNLQRGSLRQTFNCTPQCNPTVTIGDETAYFDAMVKAAEKKSSMSEKAADGPGNSQ